MSRCIAATGSGCWRADWTHLFGILIWVGHNYASVVQRPSYRPLCADDLVTPDSPRMTALLGREHGTFRWAAVVTLASGFGMLALRGWLPGALRLEGGLAPIGIGLFGIGLLWALVDSEKRSAYDRLSGTWLL